MTILNFFALACFCFLIKVSSNIIFKPLTARWFTIGICASVVLGHLLFLGLIYLNVISLNRIGYELFVLYVFGTLLLSLVPLNLLVLPFLYWQDKRIASKVNNSQLRIPENAFHALAFSGGYIGAWIGQTQFNHKVSKKSFKIKHYVLCLISMGVYACLIYWFYKA